MLRVLSRLRAGDWRLRHGRLAHGRQRTPARLVLAGALLLGSATFGVLAGGTTAANAADDSTFTVGLPNEVDSFNPFLGIEAPSYEMWALTYDQLITYNMETMAAEPGLAASWETSADGLTWTFTLRDDVLWSDGEQLTSADVKHTLDRIIDGGPEAASWGAYLKGVTTVDAPDDTTVVLNLKNPIATLPLLPMPIVPEHVWKDVSEKDVKNYSAEPEDGPVVGSGPFRLVEGEAPGLLGRRALHRRGDLPRLQGGRSDDPGAGRR
jgi:peptide/nickel transport system substrate-binding protein